MAKDYLCKDCEFNNHGWCKKRKIQGLKNIIVCEFNPNSIKVIAEVITDEITDETNSGMHKQFGKREMFHNIQMQMKTIDEDSTVKDKFKTLKQIMVNLEQMLQIEESIHGIAMEYSIDEDVHKNSIAISNKWFNEVGGYKE